MRTAIVSGIVAALIMTVLIFGPAFAFTLIGHNYFERIVDELRRMTGETGTVENASVFMTGAKDGLRVRIVRTERGELNIADLLRRKPELAGREQVRVFIAHGRNDPRPHQTFSEIASRSSSNSRELSSTVSPLMLAQRVRRSSAISPARRTLSPSAGTSPRSRARTRASSSSKWNGFAR